MPRTYGEKFLRDLVEANPSSAGVRLGRICVDANLPAAYVAKVLNVSRMTVYTWFRGRSVNEKNLRAIEAFLSLLEEDMKSGVLPAKNIKDAKQYLGGMIGVTL